MIITATDVKSLQMFFMFRILSCLYITIVLLYEDVGVMSYVTVYQSSYPSVYI